MEQKITSRKNPLLQQVRKLTTSRKERQESGLYLGDGIKLLEEAAKWDCGLETVILAEGVEAPALPAHVAVYRVPVDVMESISPMKAPQGAVFLCRLPEAKPLEVKPGTLILDGIQDPGNLGTILRTADALDVPVILVKGCADPYNWKTVRASMGAVFRTQPIQATGEAIIQACEERQIPLAVTALSAKAKDIREAPISQWAVVIGSEGQGVSDLFLNGCREELIIPMNPKCESLNAAVAATIVLWQMQGK